MPLDGPDVFGLETAGLIARALAGEDLGKGVPLRLRFDSRCGFSTPGCKNGDGGAWSWGSLYPLNAGFTSGNRKSIGLGSFEPTAAEGVGYSPILGNEPTAAGRLPIGVASTFCSFLCSLVSKEPPRATG
jgi:hypothetical protein